MVERFFLIYVLNLRICPSQLETIVSFNIHGYCAPGYKH